MRDFPKDPEDMKIWENYICGVYYVGNFSRPRLMDKGDFIQDGFESLIKYWNKHGKPIGAPYGPIARNGMVDGLRRFGIDKRNKINEPNGFINIHDLQDLNNLVYSEDGKEKFIKSRLTDLAQLGISPSAEEVTIGKELKEKLLESIKKLNKREATIINALLSGESQREIMEKFHVSEGLISQLKTKAIKTLQKAFKD